MPRVDLQVPFPDKNEAKALGARWDGGKKVWYVPDGVDSDAFRKWFPVEPEINVRAPSYFIAETSKLCWKCGEPTQAFGLLLPAGHETLEPVDEEEAGFGPDDEFTEEELQAWLNSPASSVWVQMEGPAFIHYVDYVSPSVAGRIQALTRHYRIDFSQTTESSYWMNHCEHCRMKQGDFEMYHEPHGAFFPVTEEEAAQIVLYPINRAFEGSCGGSSHSGVIYIGFGESNSGYGAELISYMRQA